MNPAVIYASLLLSFTNCKVHKINPEANPMVEVQEITHIEVSDYGGELGSFYTISLTKDSIVCFSGMAANNSSNKKAIANNPKDWDEITHSFTLNDFAKLKSGESNLPVDGTDTKITIVTKGKTYSVVNPSSDSCYYKIKGLTQLLNKYELKFQKR